jgi:hypothetical protein
MNRSQIKEELSKVLKGVQEKVNLPMLPLMEYSKIFEEEFEIEFLPEFQDTNGWQIDFGIDLCKNDLFYTLEGSLWYGNFTFSKNKNSDQDKTLLPYF